MASATVDAAFRARLAAYCAAAPADWGTVELRRPNVDLDTPPDGEAMLLLQFPVGVENQRSVGAPGANLHREEGGARFVLLAPLASDPDPWASRIDALRSHFRSKLFDGVSTFEASPPLYDDGNADGAYWAIAFVVTYRFSLFG